MTRSRRPLATLLFVCLAAALAGCGSTVQLKGAVTTQGAGLDGPSSQQDLGTQGAAAAAGSSEAGTGAAGGVGSRAGVGAASGSGSESVPRAAGGGPVISGAHTRLKVGVLAVDWNGLASQFGAAFPTNYFDVYRNVFGYLNKHGGIAGHPIQAVYHVSNGAAANRSDEDQTSCTFFTQDNSVQVVLTEGVYEPDFAACIKKKGVVQIDDGQYGLTQSDLTRLGNVIGVPL